MGFVLSKDQLSLIEMSDEHFENNTYRFIVYNGTDKTITSLTLNIMVIDEEHENTREYVVRTFISPKSVDIEWINIFDHGKGAFGKIIKATY